MTTLAIDHVLTKRLRLEPLTAQHAVEMVAVLGDPVLYEFTGGEPPSLADLKRRYLAQVAGSGDDAEQWLNWIIRETSSDQALGFVQATVEPHACEVAWTVGTSWQGKGYASEAAVGMANWLRSSQPAPLLAWIHADHVASHRVARAVGLTRTDEVDEDGEFAWREDVR